MYTVESANYQNKEMAELHSYVDIKNNYSESDGLNIGNMLEAYKFICITFKNKTASVFDKRVTEIRGLEYNWDNYGGEVPSETIIEKTVGFLRGLPQKYKNELDEDYIYPNPHGTITVEWRKLTNSVLSIEIGEHTSSFYIIQGDLEDSENELINIFESQKLMNAFNKMFM